MSRGIMLFYHCLLGILFAGGIFEFTEENYMLATITFLFVFLCTFRRIK